MGIGKVLPGSAQKHRRKTWEHLAGRDNSFLLSPLRNYAMDGGFGARSERRRARSRENVPTGSAYFN